MILQLEGISSFVMRNLIIEKLNLDEEQLKQIATIRRSARPGVANAGKPTPHEQILALLTPDQRRQWETMIGKPFLYALPNLIHFIYPIRRRIKSQILKS